MSIELILCLLILVFLIGGMLLALFNNYLPIWFCHNLGWHLQPFRIEKDGCSLIGECPRCGKSVMQDSQGNWF